MITGFSIRIPRLIMLHVLISSPVRISVPTCFRGWAHYGKRLRPMGRIDRSFIGEPNHYDNHGRCVGYSRKAGFARFQHFDNRGNPVGSSYSFAGILWIHCGLRGRKQASQRANTVIEHRE